MLVNRGGSKHHALSSRVWLGKPPIQFCIARVILIETPTQRNTPNSQSNNQEVCEFDPSRFLCLGGELHPDEGESLSLSTRDTYSCALLPCESAVRLLAARKGAEPAAFRECCAPSTCRRRSPRRSAGRRGGRWRCGRRWRTSTRARCQRSSRAARHGVVWSGPVRSGLV